MGGNSSFVRLKKGINSELLGCDEMRGRQGDKSVDRRERCELYNNIKGMGVHVCVRGYGGS